VLWQSPQVNVAPQTALPLLWQLMVLQVPPVGAKT
jgi:hypothetical protein